MKKIHLSQIPDAIEDAIRTNKKSILFVNRLLEIEPFNAWFAAQPEYVKKICAPKHLYEPDQYGILNPREDSAVIVDDLLKELNGENVIWFLDFFGEDSILGFDEVVRAVKQGFFTNRFGDGTTKRFPLDKTKLFIGYTTEPGDTYSVSEKYYEAFDEVYLTN